MRERFRRWRLRSQRRRVLRREGTAPLREFVYLDKVSVFSLISSRLGPVATEFTATESRSLTGEVSGTGGVSTGPLNFGGAVRSEATRTRGTQVLRKATVQATFKELFDAVEKDLVIRRTAKKAPDARDLPDMELTLERGCTEGWAVRAGDLRRGQLAEIEVELEAEDIFRVGAVVGTFLDLFREMPEVVDLDVRERLREAISANALLGNLLAGLVPVRGRAVDLLTVQGSKEEWVVHRKGLEAWPEGSTMDVRPLDVVAVAEESLFWKDIRQVVFSGSRYSLLCRIGRDGLHESWTPVKLVDVIRDFAPELAEQIGAAGQVLAARISRGAAGVSLDRDGRAKMYAALDRYGRALAGASGREWDSALVTEDLCPVVPNRSWTTVEEQRPPFETLTKRLQEALKIIPERNLMAELRHEALVSVGLVPLGASVVDPAKTEPAFGETGVAARLLDTEAIAIYW